jgi:hypothetical protein
MPQADPTMHAAPWILALVIMAAAACRAGPPDPASGSAHASAIATRAQEIKRELDRHREIGGGHGPIPRRAITSNTIAAVRSGLLPGDADALVQLGLDDASDVRGAAAVLLAAIDPGAEDRLLARLSMERNIRVREKLGGVLLDVKVARLAETASGVASGAHP